MKKQPISPEDLLRFFEQTAGVRFIDAETKKPALEMVAKEKKAKQKSDYDLWLEQQDEETQAEHRMAEI